MDFLAAFPVLFPSGTIALAERGLMVQVVLFMLIVAVPVLVLLYFFAWRYRAGNTTAVYKPDWQHGPMEELVWWAIPFEIVLILSALTWTSTRELDPPRPLEGGDPLVVQAVALDWKWLFIYPEQHIATLNYVVLPVGRPLKFELTADAPMNSFWIPALGGQLYAMTGMVTTLNLEATQAGEYPGRSSNYSGSGFAQMKFVAQAMPQEEFDAWVRTTQGSSLALSWDEYEELAAPSTPQGPVYYAGVADNLYSKIVAQFLDQTPGAQHTH